MTQNGHRRLVPEFKCLNVLMKIVRSPCEKWVFIYFKQDNKYGVKRISRNFVSNITVDNCNALWEWMCGTVHCGNGTSIIRCWSGKSTLLCGNGSSTVHCGSGKDIMHCGGGGRKCIVRMLVQVHGRGRLTDSQHVH